jgi:hypothetical protein
MMRMRMRGVFRVLAGCLAVSIGLHFLWDWIAFTVAAERSMQWWQSAAAVLIMLGGILFYGMLVVVGSDWSRRVFDPHSAKRLWGWPFTIVARGAATKQRSDEATE